jgi:hypothetical protein
MAYNLNYTKTTLGIRSLKEITSGGTPIKEFEYCWYSACPFKVVAACYVLECP